jgi:hypothetical protein
VNEQGENQRYLDGLRQVTHAEQVGVDDPLEYEGKSIT